MTFNTLAALPEDPIGRVYAALRQDANPNKLDLGIGVYRDAKGRSPLMASIRIAQERLTLAQETKSYLHPSGNPAYCRHAEALTLGAEHAALRDGRVLTVQTPGAGGALRAAAELIRMATPEATVWVPSPTWDHQLLVLRQAGLNVAAHPYYDAATGDLLFDEMLATLGRARRGDVVLLHGCCHNPTGRDLSPAQWVELAALLAQRGVVPFVDLVYQGFADGVEDDVFGVRTLANMVPEMILAASSSKSFAAYRDRAGSLSIIARTKGDLPNIEKHLSRITRGLYFMPPDHGAALVVEVLGDPKLKALWLEELDAMRARIVGARRLLRDALTATMPDRDFDFLTDQKGMFSLLGLSQDEVAILAARHSIYLMPDSRINVAAMTAADSARIAEAVAAVLKPIARAG